MGCHYHEPPHCRNPVRIPLTEGTKDLYVDKHNEWSSRTQDGKPSAKWEWAFLITSNGAEILTLWTETCCEPSE